MAATLVVLVGCSGGHSAAPTTTAGPTTTTFDSGPDVDYTIDAGVGTMTTMGSLHGTPADMNNQARTAIADLTIYQSTLNSRRFPDVPPKVISAAADQGAAAQTALQADLDCITGLDQSSQCANAQPTLDRAMSTFVTGLAALIPYGTRSRAQVLALLPSTTTTQPAP